MYYPKSQIKSNLFSNGDEFILDGKPYTGPYYKTSDGFSFTGESPSNPPNDLLQKIQHETNPTSKTTSLPVSGDKNSYYEIDYAYWSAKGLNYNDPGSAPSSPIQSVTTPNEQDYKVGEFIRYYLKKTNEIQYLEVSKQTYTDYQNQNSEVQWQLYKPIEITWVLVGDDKEVFNINKNIVKLSETRNKVHGFVQYFRGKFLQFHKPKEGDVKEIKTNTSPPRRGGGY